MRREEGGRFGKRNEKCYHDVGVEKLQRSIPVLGGGLIVWDRCGKGPTTSTYTNTIAFTFSFTSFREES